VCDVTGALPTRAYENWKPQAKIQNAVAGSGPMVAAETPAISYTKWRRVRRLLLCSIG
jgi:hypothetical protein